MNYLGILSIQTASYTTESHYVNIERQAERGREYKREKIRTKPGLRTERKSFDEKQMLANSLRGASQSHQKAINTIGGRIRITGEQSYCAGCGMLDWWLPGLFVFMLKKMNGIEFLLYEVERFCV